ncbi:MAG TPA: cupin domain-containing protein [Chloroflexota bacterium]|jgi:uncharacterized RmlC-like cupin family protein|nr:cupin domain-containing protein [Chloroflexota bacterium]
MKKRAATEPTCRLIRPGNTFDGRQGFSYTAGVSAGSAGASGICLHRLTMPPGVKGRAHLHESHETAIYMLSGEVETWYGDRLKHHVVVRAGDFLYIPPGCPHLPANLTDQPATCLIARTDADEQESVKLLPELDDLIPRLRGVALVTDCPTEHAA